MADSPSRRLCDASDFALYRLDLAAAVTTGAALPAALRKRRTWISSACMRRFNAAISIRWALAAFLRTEVSVRASFRATRENSFLRRLVTLGMGLNCAAAKGALPAKLRPAAT